MHKQFIDSITGYFDLQSDRRGKLSHNHRYFGHHPRVLPQYAAFCAGVLIEPFLTHFTHFSMVSDLPSIGIRVLFALIIGVLLLPNIYKATFNPAKPVSLQIVTLVLLGLGWQSLFKAAGNAAIGSQVG